MVVREESGEEGKIVALVEGRGAAVAEFDPLSYLFIPQMENEKILEIVVRKQESGDAVGAVLVARVTVAFVALVEVAVYPYPRLRRVGTDLAVAAFLLCLFVGVCNKRIASAARYLILDDERNARLSEQAVQLGKVSLFGLPFAHHPNDCRQSVHPIIRAASPLLDAGEGYARKVAV